MTTGGSTKVEIKEKEGVCKDLWECFLSLFIFCKTIAHGIAKRCINSGRGVLKQTRQTQFISTIHTMSVFIVCRFVVLLCPYLRSKKKCMLWVW